MGFDNHFTQWFQTVVSLSILDGLALNQNWVLHYMYYLCLLHTIVSYESILICCFWFPKGIFEGPTALAAAECNIIALFCECTCPDTLYGCPKNLCNSVNIPLNESCCIRLDPNPMFMASSSMEQLSFNGMFTSL